MYLQDRATNSKVPEIPNFGSLEPVGLGETLADDPEAQALLKGLEESSEQLLWKKWARRPSESPAVTSSAGKQRSTAKLPSPLDAGVASQEIRSWMKEADQTHGEQKLDESRFSLSSEEGIYSLSVLDSEEEEAYSRSLDVNKQVFQPFSPLQREVARAEETSVSRRPTQDSQQLQCCETLNCRGCKRRRGPLGQNVKSEAGAQRGAHRKYDGKEKKSGEMVRNTDVFDLQPEEENKSQGEKWRAEQRVVRAQSNDDGHCCGEMTENAGWVTRGYDKTESAVDETQKTNLFEVEGWKKEPQEQAGRGPGEKCGRVSETAEREKEDDNLTTLEEGKDEMGGVMEEERGSVGNGGGAACEVTGAGATAVNTEQRRDGKVKASHAEDLTSEDGDERGCGRDSKSSVDFKAIRGAQEGGRESRSDGAKLQTTTTTDSSAESNPSKDTNGGENVHFGDTYWTQPCSATAGSHR